MSEIDNSPTPSEKEFNIFDRDAPNGVGCLASFLGFSADLWCAGEILGAAEFAGCMPVGGVESAAVQELAAASPAINGPQATAATNPTANNPFAIDPSRGMNGPGGVA